MGHWLRRRGWGGPATWLVGMVLFGIGFGLAWAQRAWAAPPPAPLSAPHVALPASGASSLGDNLLVNPDFEDGFSQREDGAVNVAVGWQPWYLFDRGQEYERRPEWSRENLWLPSIRVLHGDFGQKVFNTWAVHNAGIYQKVYDVPVGATLEFSAWVQVWSNECDNICVSPTDKAKGCRGLTNGDYYVYVGIDPYGGAPVSRNLPLPSTIVWSDTQPPVYDRWVRVAVRAVAQADHVTVFTRSNPRIPVKHNDSYWDTAELRIVTLDSPSTVGVAQATPQPAVSAPQPTATPDYGPTLTPSPTPTPAASVKDGPAKGCWEGLTNGGLESAEGWQFGAGAGLSGERVREGQSALRLSSLTETAGGQADAFKTVYLPPDVSRATLRFWGWRSATASPTGPGAGASVPDVPGQSVVVEDLTGVPVAWAMRPSRGDDQGWRGYELDLTPYRGRNLRVHFRVASVTGDALRLDVDNVSVELCRPNTTKERERQQNSIAPRPETLQAGGSGVRLGYLRFSQTQPALPAFPSDCDPVGFEFAQFENFGAAVNLDSWTLADAEGNVYTFPYFVMPPGYRVRVWTGSGPDFVGGQVADLFAGFGGELWGDRHDTLTLRDNAGRVVTTFSYALPD